MTGSVRWGSTSRGCRSRSWSRWTDRAGHVLDLGALPPLRRNAQDARLWVG
jgi:hypothetical protein